MKWVMCLNCQERLNRLRGRLQKKKLTKSENNKTMNHCRDTKNLLVVDSRHVNYKVWKIRQLN